MNSEELIKDIEKSYGVLPTKTRASLNGIFSVVEKMRYYEEEGKRIKFRLAVGIELEDIRPRLYKLQEIHFNNDMLDEDIERASFGVIKNVISCADDNNDVYVIICESTIEAGLYFLDPDNMRDIYEKLFKCGFILFECVNENKIIVKSRKYKNVIRMDLSEGDPQGYISEIDSIAKNTEIEERWRAIFEHVKRECHGTICVFVNSDFDLASLAGRLTKEPQELTSINILYSGGGANDSLESMHALQIFLSLINHDGITIIDISGRVRSFNNICKIEEGEKFKQKHLTGSRHAAFETIKEKWDEQGLIAAYFQSQEGEIEFFRFDNRDQTENCFNARVLQFFADKENSNVFIRRVNEIKAYKDLTFNEEWRKLNYYNFLIPINNLMAVHKGVNNYYHEKDAADVLESYFQDLGWKDFVNTEFSKEPQYIYLRKQSIIAIIACIIGNSYGYTWGAQDCLRRMLEAIPEAWITEFFEKELYYDPYLLQDLSFELPCRRWNTVIARIVKDRLSNNDESNEIIGRAFSYNESYFFRMKMFMESFDDKSINIER